eukprot:6931794-Alexandrium_andersonii.AAC.1
MCIRDSGLAAVVAEAGPLPRRGSVVASAAGALAARRVRGNVRACGIHVSVKFTEGAGITGTASKSA